MKNTLAATALALVLSAGTATGGELCANAEQISKVRAFYTVNVGALPPIAARRLQMPESLMLSALDDTQVQSAAGDAFEEVWSTMSDWGTSTFLIMKGANVFEIASGVGKGSPSKQSDYYNIEYTHPVRGHLRPDLYSSVYALVLNREEGPPARGVLFYDENGASVFGVFLAGEGADPGPEEVAKFQRVWDLLKSKPNACP